jgi:Glyoxalase-like domain
MSELVADCRDAARLAAFWCEVLGFVELERAGQHRDRAAGDRIRRPAAHDRVDPSADPRPGKLRLHFDVSSSSCRTMVAGGMSSGWANTFSSV